MNKKTKTLGVIAGAFTGVILLTAGSCDKATEPFHDADRSGTTNDDPADVIEMPDGFNNLATKCDHGNRIYVTFHGDSAYGSIAVVPDDPDC